VKEITLSVTEASRGFSDLISRVHYRGESATLTKNGRVVARLVPVFRPLTGKELAKLWKEGPHLSKKDADAFAHDLKKGLQFLKPVVSPWE
jgi:prevent-host-death family protein